MIWIRCNESKQINKCLYKIKDFLKILKFYLYLEIYLNGIEKTIWNLDSSFKSSVNKTLTKLLSHWKTQDLICIRLVWNLN